jgi:hypothetical protein
MNQNKKLIFFLPILLILISSFFYFPWKIQAQNIEQLLDEISNIKAKLENFRNQLKKPEVCFGIVFQRTLREGMRGNDVKCLQALLNTDPETQVALNGAGSPNNETIYFGPLTKRAVIKFQEKYASEILNPLFLSKGTGIVGPRTIIHLNFLLTSSDAQEKKSTLEDLPQISLSVEPSTITRGQTTTLTWQASNVLTCSGTNFSTNQAISGVIVISPTETTTFSISCQGPRGSASKSVTVTVTPFGGGGGGGGGISPPSGAGNSNTPPPSSPPPSEPTSETIGCFLAGTKITMAEGNYKNIEEIKVGDLVQYYDFKEKKIKTTKVTKVYNYSPAQMSSDFYLVINNKLRVTPSQPLDRLDGSLVLAGELKVGDKVQGEKGPIEIFSIEKVKERVETYYFETESGHYFADGFSDTLKVFRAVDELLASIIDVLTKIAKIIESSKK